MLDKNASLACHGMAARLVGPSFKDVAARYKTFDGAVNLLSGKIKNGGQGNWGAIPMSAQALSAAEAGQIAQWLASGMPPLALSFLKLFHSANFLCPIGARQFKFFRFLS